MFVSSGIVLRDGWYQLTPLLDAFTIRAVSQDEFEDVKVPEAPVPSPQAGTTPITTGQAAK